MKITKEGASIIVPFQCKLCGCAYECDILECSFEQSTVLGVDIIKAVHECPWCKLTNKTDSDYFKTPDGEYLKNSIS